MRILVAVKRVPITGGKMVLSEDAQSIQTRHLGFTISPRDYLIQSDFYQDLDAFRKYQLNDFFNFSMIPLFGLLFPMKYPDSSLYP